MNPTVFFTTLVVLTTSVRAICYVNMGNITNNGVTYDLLGMGIAPENAFDSSANLSMNKDRSDAIINPAALSRLATVLSRQAEAGATNSSIAKGDDVTSLLQQFISNTNLDVNAHEVLAAADEGQWATGNLTDVAPVVKSELESQQVQECLRDRGYTLASTYFTGQAVTKTYWSMSVDLAWHWFWRVFSSAGNTEAIATFAIDKFRGASRWTSCGNFLYVRYDDQNIDSVQQMWVLAGSVWTTGNHCDTTAPWDTMVEALDQALLDYQQRKAAGLCTRLNDQGTWYADFRLVQADMAINCNQSVWDLKCVSYPG